VSVQKYPKAENAFTGHVLRVSSGREDALEGKLEATAAKGRPRRMWLDGIKQWTLLNKIEFSGEFALRHVNLLIQKTTAADDDDDEFSI